MKLSFPFTALAGLLLSFSLPLAVLADSSHARIVRLSQIQGDVRFLSEFHGDSLTDPQALWQEAHLNLPIRQGNALSTGNGRAAVEFEDGAMAFLGANTVVEFYDLSLNDGAKVTRLILRQGSASFFEHSQSGDYFSVTGGDFSVAVDSRATFRLDNFDDGSTLNVQSGHVLVLQNDKSTPLEKGQSLAVRAQNPGNQVLGRVAPSDSFDSWVSSQVQNQEVVNSQVQTNGSYSNYVAGYSDLYTYGSWFSVDGFNCWRPFGAGLGWSPFDYGSWYFDQGGYGWSFLGSSPWGWLPYHYGGWLLSPVYGWVWNPGGTFYGGQPQRYHPVTAVFVQSGNKVGLVPMHVGDKPGKTALNLSEGVFPIEKGVIGKSVPATATGNEKWSVQKNAEAAGFNRALVPAAAPLRVSSTIASSNLTARGISLGHSTIVYDSNEHRFVNSSVVTASEAKTGRPGAGSTNELNAPNAGVKATENAKARVTPIGVPPGSRSIESATQARAGSVPPRPSVTPPPARASGGNPSGSFWGNASAGPSAVASLSSSSSSSSAPSHPATGGAHPH